MLSTTVAALMSLLASSAYAMPSPQQSMPGEGVETVAAHIIAYNHPVSSNTKESFNLTLPFGYLALYQAQETTTLSLVNVTSKVAGVTVDPSRAVCRRYLDQYGQQPGSAPFFIGRDALVSTNSVEVLWLLCYTVHEDEMAKMRNGEHVDGF